MLKISAILCNVYSTATGYEKRPDIRNNPIDNMPGFKDNNTKLLV